MPFAGLHAGGDALAGSGVRLDTWLGPLDEYRNRDRRRYAELHGEAGDDAERKRDGAVDSRMGRTGLSPKRQGRGRRLVGPERVLGFDLQIQVSAESFKYIVNLFII